MTDFWKNHFTRLLDDAALGDSQKLDFSNDRVRLQTYGWILEVVGAIKDKPCLDAGCGIGDLARLLEVLGGKVEAFDFAESAVQRLQQAYPSVHWFVADLLELDRRSLGTYALVLASEVLQHVDAVKAIPILWRRVAPGGRFVATLPNARCPIVKRTMARFGGHYHGLTTDDLSRLVSGLEGVAQAWWRGATFAEDQLLAPYRLGPWTTDTGDEAEPPNRLQLVIIRQG